MEPHQAPLALVVDDNRASRDPPGDGSHLVPSLVPWIAFGCGLALDGTDGTLPVDLDAGTTIDADATVSDESAPGDDASVEKDAGDGNPSEADAGDAGGSTTS